MKFHLGNLGPGGDGGDLENVVNIGEECEEWPVQKCELQKKVVKKTNPNTACEKIPKEICAPSGCVIQPSKKVIFIVHIPFWLKASFYVIWIIFSHLHQACRTETRALLQNIPSEQCDLEPQENCKMETVLVPRYVIPTENQLLHTKLDHKTHNPDLLGLEIGVLITTLATVCNSLSLSLSLSVCLSVIKFANLSIPEHSENGVRMTFDNLISNHI